MGYKVIESFDFLNTLPKDELINIRNNKDLEFVVLISSFIDDFEVKVVSLITFFGKRVNIKFKEWNQHRSYNDEADEVIYFMKSMVRLKLLMDAQTINDIVKWVNFVDFADFKNTNISFELPNDVKVLLQSQYQKLFDIEKLLNVKGEE